MEHIIFKLAREAKRRHGGHHVHLFKLEGRKHWEECHDFDGRFHTLYYHLRPDEKTAHCVALDVLTNKFVED